MTEAIESRCVCGHLESVHGRIHFEECILPECSCLRFQAVRVDTWLFGCCDFPIDGRQHAPMCDRTATWDGPTIVEDIEQIEEVSTDFSDGVKTTLIPIQRQEDMVWGNPQQCEKCGELYRPLQFRVCPNCETDVLSIADKKGLRSA